MTTPTTTWTRLARRLGSDHNPLRRRSDRIEAWILPSVITLLLMLGPVVAAAAILWAHGDNAAIRSAERSWHRVPGVLLQATPGPAMSSNDSDSWTVWMPARWSAGGQLHTGRVPVTAGSRAGSTVPVWLDPAGQVRTPPLTAGQASDRVLLAASSAVAVLAALLTCLALACRGVLNRRRLASWEAAWQLVGPQWSRQR